jgi:hypothetical protein
MKKYLLQNKVLLGIIFILLVALLSLGYSYHANITSSAENGDDTEYVPPDDFALFGVKNVSPSDGYITGLPYYPKLTWYNMVLKQKEEHVDVDASYPRFIGGTPVQKLNQYIFDLISKSIEEDRKQISTTSDDLLSNTVSLTSGYRIVSVKNGVVSMEIVLTDFTGGGNGNHDSAIAINWDFKSNRLLKNSELFCDKNYVEKLIPLARKNIIKQFNDSDNMVHPLPQDIISWIEEGTANKDNNWDNLLITDNGVIAVFQPYQVTSGAGGIVRAFIDNKDIPDLICLPKVKDISSSDTYETYSNKPYQFNDFLTTLNPYKVSDVKFDGDFKLQDNPNYWNDWKSIFADIGSSKFDFAGHYKLISAGNGTMRDLYIVDGLTGVIYPQEKVVSTGPSTFLFKNNSRLLVLVMDNEFGFIPQTSEKKFYLYYVFQDDNTFKLLGAYIRKNNNFIKVNI